MGWTSLQSQVSKLPLVLAGPILRRVTSRSVTVWLALSAKTRVTLDVLKTDSPTNIVQTSALDDFSGTAEPIKIGQHLYLVCVTASVDVDTLQPDTLYYYNLKFPDATGTPTLLRALGATEAMPASTIAYDGKDLPSFAFEPAKLTDLRVFHGSCRKPNATGLDALALLDDFIAEAGTNALRRPHMMIMSGDQIYADEVADVLMLMLMDAAETLIPSSTPFELLPIAGTTLAPGLLAPGSRVWACDDAKLTTVDRRSHLMSVGEFIMMYLFVWSDTLWPKTLPDYDDLLAFYDAKWSDQKTSYILLGLRSDVGVQRAGVMQFQQGLKAVRRVLANVPNYMIFDDHEITDDWNMTQEFCEDVYGSALGRRVVQNGLVAYSLCQHWGNVPEQFEPGEVGYEITSEFNSKATYESFAKEEWLSKAVGVHSGSAIAARNPAGVFHDPPVQGIHQSLRYHYTIEGKNFQVIMTDTRSWRAFVSGKYEAPDLIAPAQLDDQITSTPKLGKRQLMVVVSTNMPPGAAIRQATRDLPYMDRKYIYDDLWDSWEMEKAPYARALSKIPASSIRTAAGFTRDQSYC